MSSDGEQGVSNLIAAAAQQVEILRDAMQRPEVDRAGLAQQSLELLLAAMASEATRLTTVDSLQPATRTKLSEFADAVAQLRAEWIDVHTRLQELAGDWKCSACGERVVRDAEVSGLREGTPHLELVCRACDARSPLGEAGQKMFSSQFGHLVQPGWNPRNNGFLVDEGS